MTRYFHYLMTITKNSFIGFEVINKPKINYTIIRIDSKIYLKLTKYFTVSAKFCFSRFQYK